MKNPAHNALSFHHFIRAPLQCAVAIALAVVAPASVHAQAWQQVDAIRASVGTVPVVSEGLNLTLPLVAEDGSSVPVSISADTNNATRRIVRLQLFAPNNPTPQVAEFEFGEGMADLNLTTRMRLSESQTVVAVAHTDDGRIIISERPVRVTTSGCIAPARSDPNSEMQARVRVPKSWAAGKPAEVITMVSHPMITGLAHAADGSTPPTRIINRFEATVDGRSILSVRYFRSMAANPYLKFDVTLEDGQKMDFMWKEDSGREVQLTEDIEIG